MVKGLITPGGLFQELGLNYVGPADGHDLPSLIAFLLNLKQMRGPILFHCRTQKGKGYSRSTYGVPPGHRHRRLLATDGNESPYPGGYELVKWKHVATQLRIVATQMVAGRRFLAALKVLGFVGAIEQNLLDFSSYDAESAFKEEPMHLSTGLIEHIQDSITGADYDAKSKKRVG